MENKESNQRIYQMYNEMVESFEKYEQAFMQYKTENNNYGTVLALQNQCSKIIEEIFQEENCDLYFTSLFHIRSMFYHHLNVALQNKEEIVINDITISKVICKENFNGPNKQVNKPIHDILINDANQNAHPIHKKFKSDNTNDDFHNAIKDTVVTPNSKGLCDIAGLKKQKHLLKEVIVFPMRYPQLFTGSRRPLSKALIYGPPGTGKTQLAHSIAAEVGAKLFSVTNADLLSRWVGESEKLVRTLFQYCLESHENSIIFMDEVDSFCRKRIPSEAEHSRRIKNELLTQLSILDNTSSNTKVFFLAATNCPWDIDPAFLRRFHRRIYVPLPDRDTRLEMLKLFTKDLSKSIPETKWNEIVDRTQGYSGSDIADIINAATYQPIQELENSTNWTITCDSMYMPLEKPTLFSFKSNIKSIPSQQITVRDVTIDDFINALKNATKTVSNEDIVKYNEFNKEFGSIKN